VVKNIQTEQVSSVRVSVILNLWGRILQGINFEVMEKEMFSDHNLTKVFDSLTNTPKSAKTIANESGVSTTTTYRKIRELKEKRLVAVSGILDDDGRRNFLYRKKDEYIGRKKIRQARC